MATSLFMRCTLALLLIQSTLSRKHLKVESLDAISTRDHHEIFAPLLQNMGSSKHDILVEDLYGKYMRLQYEATHPTNSAFIKLDGMTTVDSLVCLEDDENTMELQMTSVAAANTLYRSVSVHLKTHHSDDGIDGAYFITGSHEWLCRDKRSMRYAPVQRRIVSVELEEDMLILSTEYATYPEMFETLDLEFKSNAKLFHSPSDKSVTSSVTSSVTVADKPVRRRLSWWSDFWDDICAGVNTLVSHVEDLIDTLAGFAEDLYDGVQDAIDVVEGKKVVRNMTDNYFWSYNYDSNTATRNTTFYLDSDKHVECLNCYVWFNLEYTFKIRIEDRTMKYLYVVAEGTAEIVAVVEMKAEFNLEYNINTPHVPIPYLGISVGGVAFGFTVYGGLGIGAKVEIDYIYMGYTAIGSIKRGIEYDADKNIQNYIGEHDFNYQKIGPQLEFESMNVTLYIKPTIHLALEYVGDIYFGVQAQVEFTFTKDVNYGSSDSAACAIDYVPTAKLLLFVGAKLKPLNLYTVWDKDASVEVAHSTLTDLEGCITQSALTTLETYLQSWGSRRRLAIGNNELTSYAYVDYTNTHLTDISRKTGWGSMNARWWGNMSSLPTVCPSGRMLEADNETHAIEMPEQGQLVIKVDDNDNGQSLVGVLKTFVELYYDDWGITTNVTCLSRMQLSKTSAMSEFENIDNYDVSLLEWYCDLNLSMVGIEEGSALETAWIDMISLPDTMNVLVLDASFNAMMLFDSEWCQTFVLTKQRKYHVDLQQLLSYAFVSQEASYPSQQWFGSYHCSHSTVTSMSLYFEDFFWGNGTGNAWLLRGDEAVYMQGKVNYEDFSATLWSEEHSLGFVGLITLMQDGSVLYSGAVNADNCTGFVFKGWMDTSPFESMVDAGTGTGGLLTTSEPDGLTGCQEETTKDQMWTGMAIGFGSGLGLILVLMVFCKLLGYSVQRQKKIATSYNLMQENSGMMEMSAGNPTL